MADLVDNSISCSTPPWLAPAADMNSCGLYASSQEEDEDIVCLERRPTPPLRMCIYPHPTKPLWYVNVVPYCPDWPAQYEAIRAHLHHVFTTTTPDTISTAEAAPPAQLYQTIEHVGSTSIPGLAAKPNIDVLVTFPTQASLAAAIEALNWEIPTQPPFVRYTQCPNGGGLPGRESFKLYLPDYDPYYSCTPARSVYLIADTPENEVGRMQIRCYRTVKNVLGAVGNRDLLDEYGRVKMELAREIFTNPLEYAAQKDGVVRKILRRGGWTEGEVDLKDALNRREYVRSVEEEPY